MNRNERGLTASDMNRIRQYDRDSIASKDSINSRREQRYQLAQQYRKNFNIAKKILSELPQGIDIYRYTPTNKGLTPRKTKVVRYNTNSANLNDLYIQEGEKIYPIGIISYILETKLAKKSSDGKSIEPNQKVIDHYTSPTRQFTPNSC